MIRKLERVADVVRRESGIDVSGPRLTLLEAAIRRTAPDLDPPGLLRALGEPGSGATLATRLVEAVAVHETYFLREPRDLEAIDWRALLELARADGRDRARAWVAACSTGEEAYTLAMLAAEAFGVADPPVSIVATDISTPAMLRAEGGSYGRRSTRHLGEDRRRRWFDPAGDRLVVGDALRRMVELRRHNLVHDPPVGARFDLILCRNVLIYFDGPTVERVVSSLEGALAPGGSLVLGAADRLCAQTARPRGADGPRPAPARGLRRRAARPAAAMRRAAPASPPASIARALTAANAGRVAEAIELASELLAADPLDADAHFVCGVARLEQGDAKSASESLRRALYVDPTFALAAFQLGRAHETLGDRRAARRAYDQALRTSAPAHRGHPRPVADVDLADVAAACRARLAALAAAS